MTAPARPVAERQAAGLGAWPRVALEAELATIVAGCRVEVVGEIDSTNTELMRRIRAGDCPATLLVAERQTAGRGRLGRVWQSENTAVANQGEGPAPGPLASLTFSLGMALAPKDWSGLSLVVGLVVARCLHPALGLKWPNDIWLDGRKLAGILIETASVAERRFTVVGVGINILPRDASGLATAPACLRELLPGIDAAGALLRIAAPLARAIVLFEEQGFPAFRAEFERRDVLRGQSVSLSDGRVGDALGVDERGALLVHTSDGMQRVTSAEVSVRPTGARSGGPR